MQALSPAAPAAQPVEIWIRKVGARRQAFCRPVQPAGQRTRSWHGLPVPLADKALRDGKLTTGIFAGAAVVPRETPDDEHPAAAAFRESAQLLNREIDSINGAAGTTA